MTDIRSAQRFRLTVIVALVSTLALGSFWILEIMRRSAEGSIPERPRSEPDYYVEKFNFVRTSKTGQVQYHISGERLTHNPQDDSYEIQRPLVNSLFEEGPPMTTQAMRARIDSNRSQVHLFDNVIAERPSSATTEYFQIKSEYLLILPEDDTMQTDLPVRFRFGESVLTGKGMVANNATRKFSILSRAHAVYQPPAVNRSR